MNQYIKLFEQFISEAKVEEDEPVEILNDYLDKLIKKGVSDDIILIMLYDNILTKKQQERVDSMKNHGKYEDEILGKLLSSFLSNKQCLDAIKIIKQKYKIK